MDILDIIIFGGTSVVCYSVPIHNRKVKSQFLPRDSLFRFHKDHEIAFERNIFYVYLHLLFHFRIRIQFTFNIFFFEI